MRIIELLEGRRIIDFESFITKDQNKKETIDYDLTEDLIYYMNHDDTIYRKYVYPVVSRIINSIKKNKSIDVGIFKDMVNNSYLSYRKKFDIRVLPITLNDEQLKDVCNKFYNKLVTYVNNKRFD